MTNVVIFGRIRGSMFYVLAIAMFLAGCIIALGYAGRSPREDRDPTRGKEP